MAARKVARGRDRKSEYLRIMLTGSQKQALGTAAKRAGLEQATWARLVLLREAGVLKKE